MYSVSIFNVPVSVWDVCVICAACVCVYLLLPRPRGLPPGPSYWLPVLGNLLDVTPDARVFLTDFRQRYGDVYSLYLGKHLAVVIAGYDVIKEVLHKRVDAFSDRHNNYLFDRLSEGGKGITFASGDIWKQHRAFATATLKEFGVGRSIIEGTIHLQAELLINTIDSERGAGFDPRVRLQTSVCNIISSIVFGRQFAQGNDTVTTLTEHVHANISNAGVSTIVQFIPALRFVPGDPFRIQEIFRNDKIIQTYATKIIDEHMQKFDPNVIEDFTDAFIKEMKRQDGLGNTHTFTGDQLRHVIADLFFAGTDTTASALAWALVYLMNHPDIQERMFTEIEEQVGLDALPGVDDRTKLPLTEAVYMEVLRHAELLCLGVPRSVSRDVELRGFTIPAGAMIMPDIHSVLKDPALWQDPDVFNPDRFIGTDGSVRRPEHFIPFSMGRRNCLGDSLAKTELFLFLSALVQSFQFRPPAGADVSLATLDGVFGIVHSPKPFKVVAVRRKHV